MRLHCGYCDDQAGCVLGAVYANEAQAWTRCACRCHDARIAPSAASSATQRPSEGKDRPTPPQGP